MREIARLPAEKIRNSVTIDREFRESVRAKSRLEVRKILRKYDSIRPICKKKQQKRFFDKRKRYPKNQQSKSSDKIDLLLSIAS
ncbi:MAG: DUF3387 domain-containing protein [Holosporaceae bacterium]|nr:DUF3387 domain-containing protein [Holosporaceae bacterium]